MPTVQYYWDMSAVELPYWHDCCPHSPFYNEEFTVQLNGNEGEKHCVKYVPWTLGLPELLGQLKK